ncbi:MAG: rod shape-determining protein RodA [Porphyromonadaceae bacterium]|nr:rod shape-determining protein RodA [Porphyromonadaceae bacterium]
MIRGRNIWYSIDWYTVILYLILIVWGLASIYETNFEAESLSNLFRFNTLAGKQLLWIFLSLATAFFVMMLDSRTLIALSYPLYIIFLALLILTLFVAPDIRGSRSWIVLGPLSLQPAEYALFGTVLALSKMIDNYDFNLTKFSCFFRACALILLPAFLILMQKETGIAIVYISLLFILYREGMSSLFLFAAFCAITYFILIVKYASVVWFMTPVGAWIVLTIILLVLAFMVSLYLRQVRFFRMTLLVALITEGIGIVVSRYLYAFNLLYIAWTLLVLALLAAVALYFKTFKRRLWIAVAFAVFSCLFLKSVDYIFTHLLEPYQRTRIEIALGVTDDPKGGGYNVHQAKIAIGSGGFLGKGFLNATQTKLRYIPEQHTDFIFCTIGEAQGFCGTAGVLILFSLLLVRIIQLAERQRLVFGRVYGYSIAAIIFFHLAINIGMVVGIVPVIGIPLPFFSYGGSSLWTFTLLLFTLLCLDASREDILLR